MHTLTQLRAMLEERGLSPRKALGQNFLVDQNLIRKLVEASGVGEGDLVLEVGPGAGALTEALLARGCRVVAVELDAGLADLVRDRFGADPRFTLVRGDAMEGKHAVSAGALSALAERGGSFRLVANLPYNIATPLMLTLLADHHPALDRAAGRPACAGMWVTIQKDVAERLWAAHGGGVYGAASVMAQALARVERVAVLPPECFWPRPGVVSAMVAVTPLERPLTRDPAGLEAMCRTLFSKRRKQLGTILGRGASWPEGVTADRRPEELTPAQIVALAAGWAGGQPG